MRALALVLVSLSTLAMAADTPPSPAPSPSKAGAAGTTAADPKEKNKDKGAPAADASAKEKPRRPSPPKGAKKPPPTYTNQDLPAEPAPVPLASPGTGKAGGTVSEVGRPADALAPVEEPTPPPPDEETERYWEDRANQQRRAITDAEVQVAVLEQRISELRNDRNPTNVMDPNREQTRQAQIAQAQADLEAARIALEAAKRGLADLEEEARRKNIPPGWLRERF
jgi:hypothetical protein